MPKGTFLASLPMCMCSFWHSFDSREHYHTIIITQLPKEFFFITDMILLLFKPVPGKTFFVEPNQIENWVENSK